MEIDAYFCFKGANATLNKYGGRSFAATISFATGLLAVLVFFAIDVTALGTPLPTAKLTSKFLMIENIVYTSCWKLICVLLKLFSCARVCLDRRNLRRILCYCQCAYRTSTGCSNGLECICVRTGKL